MSDNSKPRVFSVDDKMETEFEQSVGAEAAIPASFAAVISDIAQANDTLAATAFVGNVRVNLGGITNPRKFWDQIVIPNMQDFSDHRSARTAFNLAQSLWAMTEWVWYNWPGPGLSPASKEIYVNDQIAKCGNLAYVRDIAEAAKHCYLGRKTVQTIRVNAITLEVSAKGVGTVQMDDLLQTVFLYWPVELGFK